MRIFSELEWDFLEANKQYLEQQLNTRFLDSIPGYSEDDWEKLDKSNLDREAILWFNKHFLCVWTSSINGQDIYAPKGFLEFMDKFLLPVKFSIELNEKLSRKAECRSTLKI